MSVHLREMTTEEFSVFLETSIKDYAEDKIAAGTWDSTEAVAKSKESFQRLLPQEQATPNEHLLMLVDETTNSTIGSIWFHEENTKAFIYDFIIFEEYRNQGYGGAALAALELFVSTFGIKQIDLHVFAHNKAAVHLYEKVGFIATDISMSKKISN